MKTHHVLYVFYFVLGCVQLLPSVAMNFFARDQLGLSPAAVGTVTSLVTIPWVCKPFFGFVSDTIPIRRMRRKPYIVLASMAAACGWMAMAAVPATVAGTVVLLLFVQVCVVMSDVVADSIMVERVRETELNNPARRGTLQSATWTFRFSGSILASFFSGFIVQYVPPRAVFALTSMPLLVTSVCASMFEDKRVRLTSTAAKELETSGWQGTEYDMLTGAAREVRSTNWSRIVASSKRVLTVIKQPGIWRPTLFLFAVASTPGNSTAMFFFYTQSRDVGGLGFPPWFVGMLSVISNMAGLLGVQLYRRTRLRHCNLRTLFTWVTVAITLMQSTELILTTRLNVKLGIPDQLFVISSDIIEDITESLAFLPLVCMVARLCPEGIEGSIYASIISFSNMGGIVSRLLGAAVASALGVSMVNFTRLWVVSLICTLSIPLPLFWVKAIPLDS